MIGVFDSGHGGLTVLKALLAQCRNQGFIYLGDHGHAPYGHRSPEEITDLSREAILWLFKQGCRLVILACNTASAIALRPLQQNWLPQVASDRRILGVIVPTIEAVTGVPWLQTQPDFSFPPRPARLVAVFATPRTVESNAFPREIACRAPHIQVVQQACSTLAGQIEATASAKILNAIVTSEVTALLEKTQGKIPDVTLLGCTHYPIVAQEFRQALPPSTALLSQPDLVVASLKHYLQRHPQFQTGPAPLKLFTTGNPKNVGLAAARLFGLEFQNFQAAN